MRFYAALPLVGPLSCFGSLADRLVTGRLVTDRLVAGRLVTDRLVAGRLVIDCLGATGVRLRKWVG